MQVENNTPFPATSWESVDANRRWYYSSLVRVKYTFHQTGDKETLALRLTPDQGELFAGDTHYDDNISQPVRYESDYIPCKPKTDIIVNAQSWSPSRQPEKAWECGIRVTDPNGKLLKNARLRVCGERHWKKLPMGWRKTAMQAVRSVRLSYDHARGGSIPNPRADEDGQPMVLAWDSHNPAGTGITHHKMPDDPFPVAQVKWASMALNRKPGPPGFGFINRGWQSRLDHAGTYDQAWLDNQHPFPPQDFNPYHHQAANPELILDGYIDSHSQFELENLLPDSPMTRFRLPALHCFIDCLYESGKQHRYQLPMDTVLIDIESENKADWAVYLSYRRYLPIEDPLQTLRFQYLPVDLLAGQQQPKEKEPAHG